MQEDNHFNIVLLDTGRSNVLVSQEIKDGWTFLKGFMFSGSKLKTCLDAIGDGRSHASYTKIVWEGLG